MVYYFNFDPVWRGFGKLLDGLALGLEMAVVSLLAGTLIGIVCAHARLSSSALVRRAVWSYVEFIRNSPILLLIFFVYFGLPEVGIYSLDKYQSFVLTLSIYAGAYLTEVFRVGLVSVPVRYVEAAKAIGLRPFQRQIYVVFPVLFRIVLPSLSNNLISLFKDTSLATAIAVPELTFEAREINTYTFRVIETWLVASGLYLATCYAIAFALRLVERRYAVIR
ncbi:MAG: amino acid ABC transporter permease [Methylobacteriaceae bacterium]|nr:amino acid ABC transporter permease [Methylobacteriaceae bacterium]MBV9636219.1 amino acid ABC transporter permease [Methylobacteriaceae bacterium]MBV9702589.1 amino acid ABC transporter permease [Methylobacteriaceae bacterium]